MIVFRCEIQLNLLFEWRQLSISIISYMFFKATCPLEVLVMMNNQDTILCDTNIHLKHVYVVFYFLKGLYRILGSNPGSTTMGYS